MEKFLTKENILIICVVFWAIIQSNYFATKLDLANLKNETLQLKTELMRYSDAKDEALLKEIDSKYNLILNKLDKMR